MGFSRLRVRAEDLVDQRRAARWRSIKLKAEQISPNSLDFKLIFEKVLLAPCRRRRLVTDLTRKGGALTYSIVGRDPETGQLGVAVQSHYLAVGARVPWGAAGIGVVATQAVSNPAYGIGGLDALSRGSSPQAALNECLARDENRDTRQVAMLDANGTAAAHTGALCWRHAAHHVESDVSAQANMVASDEIPAAMAAAFLGSHGALPERLLAALDAAQELGGDLRGQQSAALLCVDGSVPSDQSSGVVLNLRCDDHLAPLTELRRAYDRHVAFQPMLEAMGGPVCRGPVLASAAEVERALIAFDAGQAVYGADNYEPSFWKAVALWRSDRHAEAASLVEQIAAANPGWELIFDHVVNPTPASAGRSR
jgi:uncharacterized Ntn-hydrolase superfamily protein